MPYSAVAGFKAYVYINDNSVFVAISAFSFFKHSSSAAGYYSAL
jgi:hypothetical protein